MTKVHESFKLVSKAISHKGESGIKVEIPAIYETTNEDVIKFSHVNRLTKINGIITLGNSLIELAHNLRDIVVAKIGDDFYYIDGQHLAKALFKLGLPIRFKLVYLNDEEEALKFITKMNSSARNWSLKQYIESYSKVNKDLVYLNELNAQTSVSYSTLGIVLTNQSMSYVKKSIKDGTFKITEKKAAKIRVDVVINFYQITGVKVSQYCTHGLIDFIKNLPNGLNDYLANEGRFLAVVECGKIVPKVPLGQRETYVELFSKCWNKSKGGKFKALKERLAEMEN